MKKTLIKALSSTIALTLVLASATVGAAPAGKIPADEIKAVKATAAVQEVKEEAKSEVKEDGILAAIEAKVKEEAIAEVKEAEAPAVEIAKTAAAAEITAPKAEAKEEAKAVPEIKVVPAAEVKAEAPETPAEAEAPEVIEEEPAVEWDVSATEFDNVAMAFYAEPVAPASQVNFDTQSGVVVISGTGAMEEAVYRHFATTERFVSALKALFEAEYGVEVYAVYDESITDIVELDANLHIYSSETGEELEVTENMRMDLNPADFLKYSPSTIIVDEGITNISDFAFLFCGDLEEVVLPSTIETIGEGAFKYCGNLTRIVIPETAELEDGVFNYCHSLTDVELVSADSYGDPMAESIDGGASNRTLTAEEINALVYG